MMSHTHFDAQALSGAEVDKEILRIALIAELDAVNLYDQMAAATKNGDLKKLLMDIAKEEKTHIGEFQALLLKYDDEQVRELASGKEEVDELVG